MGTEIGILAIYGLVVIIAIFAQVLLAVPQAGLTYLVSNREPPKTLTGMAGRLERGANNCLFGLAMFAPAALLIHIGELSTASTLLAAQLFLWARIIYIVVFAFGIPWVRTLSWVVATLATAYLYIAAL